MSSTIQKIETDVDFGFGEVDAIMELAIKDGLVSFSTDTSQIFVDFEGTRFCFDSIIMYDTELEIMSLTSFAKGKLFFAKDTKNLYMNTEGRWEVVFESSETMLENIPVYTDLEYVTGNLPATGDPKHIYIKRNTVQNSEGVEVGKDYAGVLYEVYLYKEGEGFFRIIPSKDEITTIIEGQLDTLSKELDARLAVSLMLLGEHDSADATMQEAVAEALSNYYTRDLTYNRTEVDDKFTQAATTQNNNLVEAINNVKKIKSITSLYTNTPNEIVLNNDSNLYVTETDYIITFNTGSLEDIPNAVYSFDLVIKGCTRITPIINENIVWAENATPDYTFENVLISFKTFNKGGTWLGFYQGGWNGNNWIN